MLHLKMVPFKIINTLILFFKQTLPRKWLATSDTVIITISAYFYNRPIEITVLNLTLKKNQYKAFIPSYISKFPSPALQEIIDISIVSILEHGSNQRFLSQMPLWKLTSDLADSFGGYKKPDTIFPSVIRVMKSLGASDMFRCWNY